MKISKIQGNLRFTGGALRVFPGGNQVGGLPPEPNIKNIGTSRFLEKLCSIELIFSEDFICVVNFVLRQHQRKTLRKS